MKKQIPNILTSIRLISPIAIIPLIIYREYLWALIIFILAIITDLVDGVIARKMKTVSHFGAMLDAITDKVFLYSIFIFLIFSHKNLAILLIFELLIAGINILRWKSSINGETNIMGKIKTFFVYILLGMFILSEFINNSFYLLFNVIFIITIILEIFTFISYLLNYFYGKNILENHIIGFNILKFLLTPIFNFYYKPTIINKEAIPKTGAVIIAGNHRHLFDQCLVIPSTSRMIHYMAKKEYFDSFKTKWFFETAGCISVNRKIKDTSATTSAIELLKRGEVLGIFPEGTRNKTNDILLPFKYGTVSMAYKTNATIVPFAIRGEYKKSKNNLVIEFGKPFKVNENLEESNKQLEEEVKKLYLKGAK